MSSVITVVSCLGQHKISRFPPVYYVKHIGLKNDEIGRHGAPDVALDLSETVLVRHSIRFPQSDLFPTEGLRPY